FADHHNRRIIGAESDQVAAADLALDREAEVFQESFDGQVEGGFQAKTPAPRSGPRLNVHQSSRKSIKRLIRGLVQTRPLTGRSAPVTALAASLARNKMTSANSFGVTHFEKSALGMPARFAGVSMVDGSTALTVTLPFNSAARASVRRCTPAFDAADGPMPEAACNAAIAPTLIMRPAPEAIKCGIADREAFSAVNTLSAYMRCQVFISPSATVSNAKPPAILISASS